MVVEGVESFPAFRGGYVACEEHGVEFAVCGHRVEGGDGHAVDVAGEGHGEEALAWNQRLES